MQQNQVPCGRPLLAFRTARAAGFTLVEIMVVVVILGLLATLVVPNVLGMSEEAKLGKAQLDVKMIADAVTRFKMKNSRTPELSELTTPDEKGKTYIDELPQDPWDHDYQIRDLESGKFEVISWGPDGNADTEDDISSRIQKK